MKEILSHRINARNQCL